METTTPCVLPSVRAAASPLYAGAMRSATGPNMIGQEKKERKKKEVVRPAGRDWEAVRLAARIGLHFSITI